jgi:hypothetical protein
MIKLLSYSFIAGLALAIAVGLGLLGAHNALPADHSLLVTVAVAFQVSLFFVLESFLSDEVIDPHS